MIWPSSAAGIKISQSTAQKSAAVPDAGLIGKNILGSELSHPLGRRPAEWSPEEAYVSMPSPGADAWLSIDRETGAVEFERTARGAVSYLNDLHKGRNAGPAWGWFIDVFAIATLVFCITGLFLLYLHARQRRMTWPLVGLGLLVPLLIALLLIH